MVCIVCVGVNCSVDVLHSKPGCEFNLRPFTNEYLCSDVVELLLIFASQLLLLLQPLEKRSDLKTERLDGSGPARSAARMDLYRLHLRVLLHE